MIETFQPTECTECESTNIEEVASTPYKGKYYNTYKCKDCKNIMSNEPDWDSLPGGHDDN